MADLPPHPYIPGQTPRHPEDWFDPVKASVTADIAPHRLHETEAWQAGLTYFHAGYFWECHEVLEAIWMHCPEGSAEREMTQAVIQLANARLKLRMGKPRAVLRLCDKVAEHLARCPEAGRVLGLSPDEVGRWAGQTRSDVI